MTARIAMPAEGIAAFCERWQVTEFALFCRRVDLVSRRGID